MASYRLGNTFGLAATREVLAMTVSDTRGFHGSDQDSVALWQRNDDGTLRFVSRHDSFRPIDLAASPAGGLVFSRSGFSAFITVWQVLGIPRVQARQEVRVMVNAEQAPVSALTVIVEARQGSRVRTAAATLMPSDTQAEAVFPGSDLGQGEWIFSASVPADMENIADASAARATLRIGGPLVRLSNLSDEILEGADLNIRVSTEGMVPVAGDTEVTLRATREGAQPRTAMGLLQEGQTSVTVTFVGRESLTEGGWVLSVESSILSTDANSTLAVTVGPPLPRLTLSVDQGVPSGEIRLVQTDVNFGNADNASFFIEGLAVSPDGRWLLASTSPGITVWEIDSVRGIVTQRDALTGAGLGLGGPLAVSRDSSFVFTSDRARTSTISVWRLGADDGRLDAVAEYTEGGTDAAGNTVRGLIRTHDIVPSPDDRLLFVTSLGGLDGAGGALSVWSIGTSGTLTQTDVHVSAGASDTEGLNRIAGAAVTPDGRLLFAGSGHDSDSLDSSTLGIWRVNAEASTVSFVRALSDRRMPRRPGVVTLGPAGRFLFVLNDIRADAETGLLSVYEVNAAEENLASVASYGEDIPEGTIGLAATREVLTVATPNQGSVALWQRNDNGTLRFASRHDSFIPIDLAASPAGGLVFSRAFPFFSFLPFITVWQVQGIPRVPAGQEVRVMVNAEQAPVSALTVIVEARQGSRVRTAAATLMPSDTQAEAVFSGSALGQGEWIFSASVPADMADIADASAARATLRIGGPLVRLENLSDETPEGADLNIRVSTEGMIPVAGDTEVTLRATREGAQPRTAMGLLREGQTSVTVTFVGRESLTEGGWVLSVESSILSTDANSTLAVTVGPPLPRLTLSVDQGVPSGEMRLVQTDVNFDNAGNTSLFPEGLAVSPDGRWLLASTSRGIMVWEIDSVRGIVTQRDAHTGAGLGGSLAVSRDSGLVFASDGARTSTISVWRLGADDGFLNAVAEYTEGGTDAAGNTVRGLINVGDVVPSPDDRLLFVTSGGESDSAGSALSVWSIGTSGTLTQTDVHVSAGASDTEGLNRIAGAAVTPDGRLLFAGSDLDLDSLDHGTLGIWRVNAEASTVSFVRALSDRRMLRRPGVVTLGPAGRFLFVVNIIANDAETDPLSVYEVNAAEENLANLASYSEDILGEAYGLAATREVLAVTEFERGNVTLWQRNDDGTLRFVSRHASFRPIDLAASPAGGLVFSRALPFFSLVPFITVWQVLGIPRVPAGQEVRVMVNAEQAPVSALTVIVEARQGSRVRTAAATLMPSDTQAEAVFSGSALGQGEWIFSASVPADMADIADASAARATLRIGGPLVRLENLSDETPEGADLNIRVSTEGMVPVAGDTEVTLRATREGAQPRTAMGLLREGQTSVTVTFADRESLTEGGWVLSAESSILSTDANSTLAVTVGPPLPRLTLSVDQGVTSGEMRLVQTDAKVSGGSFPIDGPRLAVSPDGRWLLTSSGNEEDSIIRVWEIDSARGIVTQTSTHTGAGRGLGGSLAVSPDSSLVFASDGGDPGTISVWRLGADDGRLDAVAQYTGGGTDAAGNTVKGLIFVWEIVPSPDGRLLFVTSEELTDDESALSVWSIGTSGTLTQTDVHVSAGASDTEGLNGITGAAVTPDGRLLFTVSYGNMLGIWRVNAEASTIAFVRTLSDRRLLNAPQTVTLGPAGRFLFVANAFVSNIDQSVSVYEVDAAEENLAFVASYGEDISEGAFDLAATREVLAVAEFSSSSVALWQRNDDGTLRFVSSHDSVAPIDLAASPAGGLVFSRSGFPRSGFPAFITVWQVLGIPRVPARQEVRVVVNAERAPVSALTVIVEARQGSRVRTAAATLMPSDTQAEAVFPGSDLGQGEWIFSASVPADMENIADASAARATLRISGPLIRLSNLSDETPEGADLNIRVSTEGMVPVAGDTEVTLRATREGAQPRTAMGLLREGQTSVTVTFVGRESLTEGGWVLSAESSILSTDANSTLAVTVGPPLPRLTLSVDQGVPSGEIRLVQTDVNFSNADNASFFVEGLAVSPDGRWLLASIGGTTPSITVWEIDSVRGIVTQRDALTGAGLGLGGPLAVSRDSSLVFASDRASTSTISVWRLGADDGRLDAVAQYTEGGTDAAGNTVRGLIRTHDIVPSPDDRLLFVTSLGGLDGAGGALSVWSIGPSGTLVQTDVHVSAGALDTEGLNRIAGAAVTPDGRLLFAGSGHDSDSLDSSTLGIWRVNAEASTVSFVRALSDRRLLRRPGVVTLGPAGRFLFVVNDIRADAETDPLLSVYEVNAAEENLASVASYGEDISEGTYGLAATREVLAVAEFSGNNVALWQRNDDGTLRFASRHDSFIPVDLAASPAGGLVFSRALPFFSSLPFITVWQVQGIPRVPAGQEVRVMVNAEQAPVSALTVIVEARQGSRVRTAAATLMPSDTQAEAVFPGSDLGQGEWIFSVSVPADMADIADASAARTTLRIGSPAYQAGKPVGRNTRRSRSEYQSKHGRNGSCGRGYGGDPAGNAGRRSASDGDGIVTGGADIGHGDLCRQGIPDRGWLGLVGRIINPVHR